VPGIHRLDQLVGAHDKADVFRAAHRDVARQQLV
jgi:hypothetical protein